MRTTDARLIWTIAATQFVGWGTLFTPFALVIGPMEQELGWSRSLISGAFTVGLLLSGVLAVPAGRWVDRHGGRGAIAWGGLAGAALVLAWSFVSTPLGFYAVWLGLGVVHAFALWGSAMAVMVATARDPMRSITALTFITGFTGTFFVPVIAALVEWLGWRGALMVLAVIQALPTPLALWGLAGTEPRARAAQDIVYDAGRREPFLVPQKDGRPGVNRDWFSAIYQVLLGQPEGPRFGGFIALYGVAGTISLIETALAREETPAA